jgi:hypothetical protein
MSFSKHKLKTQKILNDFLFFCKNFRRLHITKNFILVLRFFWVFKKVKSSFKNFFLFAENFSKIQDFFFKKFFTQKFFSVILCFLFPVIYWYDFLTIYILEIFKKDEIIQLFFFPFKRSVFSFPCLSFRKTKTIFDRKKFFWKNSKEKNKN